MTRRSDEFESGENQILDLAYDIARSKGFHLTLNQIEKAPQDFILRIGAGDKMAHAELYEAEIEDYPGKAGMNMTRQKVVNAVYRLYAMLSN